MYLDKIVQKNVCQIETLGASSYDYSLTPNLSTKVICDASKKIPQERNHNSATACSPLYLRDPTFGRRLVAYCG